VPSVTTFQNLGLNAGPTFFGCDAANFTTGKNIPPLIVYLPNGPYVYNSNISTFDPSYNTTERNAIVANGYELATQGDGTLDSEWATCVGCAVLSRSLYRTNTDVPDACTKCFDKYCWDGTIDESAPAQWVPAMKLEDERIDVTSAAAERLGGVAVAVLVALVMGVVNSA
jgi:lysophospholipase